MKDTVLKMFDAGRFQEGETKLKSLITKTLHYAGVYDLSQGVAGAKEARGKQMTDFDAAFEKMIEQTREASKRYRLADQMYNTAIKQFATAAIGISMSRDAMKSMTNEKKWEELLEAQFGGAAEEVTVVGRNFGHEGVRTPADIRVVLPPPAAAPPLLPTKPTQYPGVPPPGGPRHR
eukprot:3937661-Rhodomonas_salina.1